MKTTRAANLIAATLVGALSVTTAGAQAADSRYKFERGFPAAGTAEKAYDAADLRRAIEAYKFFYGTVATEAVMQQGLAAGAKVNEVGIVMATSPRQQFGGANADTPYAITTVDLKASGPMVVELPPGPFIGFVDDHNMRWVQDMGTIGPEKGQGGKHLILPPDYTGTCPRATTRAEARPGRWWCSSGSCPSAATSPRRSRRSTASRCIRWPGPASRSPIVSST